MAVRVCIAVLALALFAQTTMVNAQAPATSGTGPSTDPASTADLQLSRAQKQTIYTSLHNLNIKNEALADFQPIVGAVVPSEVKLEAMPKTIGELAPRVKDFQVAMISGRVVVVEPRDRRIVEVIAGEQN
jgi:hypothetical protein